MIWVESDLNDHVVPTPLPWAGTPATRPGYSKSHPDWPWTLPGRGQPQPSLGNLFQCLTTLTLKNLFLIS